MNGNKLKPFAQEQGAALRSIFSLLGLNFVIYCLIRLTFYFWNFTQLKNIDFSDLLKVFINGARFDLAVVFPLSFLSFLFLNAKPKSIFKIIFWIFVILHTIILCGNFVDSELVNFVGRRFTKSTLYLIGEGNITNLMKYFWMTLVTFVSLALYLFFNLQIFKNNQKIKLSLKQKVISSFIFLIITIIFARGGFQEKPISFVDAKVIEHPFAHHMVLNTTFSAAKSFGQKSFERLHFFSEEKMLSELNLPKTTKTVVSPLMNKNLVLIILESFSTEYLSKENTPYFLELAQHGSYFKNSYANGRRSVEGIASIMAGVPALMEEPFVNSEFATNDFVGLGQLFKKKNYYTSFYHGAKNGSMRFDLFTRAAGFDHYYGLNEFPDATKHDGSWGIWDEDFLKWSCEQTTEFKKPFATTIFTLTSHHPFAVPEHLKDQFLENTSHPILRSIQYTDFALKKYFECAQKQDWFKDTLFVLVADHTGPSLNIDANFKSKYEIPILLYAPDTDLKLNTNQFAQQIDLLPTLNDLFDLGLLNKNYLARSLFVTGPKTIALYADQHFELVGDTDLSDNKLKAIRQYYSEGLFDNRLYFPQIK